MKLTGAWMADWVSTLLGGSSSCGKVLISVSSAAASQFVAAKVLYGLIAWFSAGRRTRQGLLFTAFVCFSKDLSGRGAARNFVEQSVGAKAELDVSPNEDHLRKHLNVERLSG